MAENWNSQRKIDGSKTVEWLAVIAALLTVASSAAVFTHRVIAPDSTVARKLMKALYVELELNVPAFFSATLMLGAAALLALIWSNARQRGDQRSLMWAVLAAGFAAMAFDELVSVHERLIEPMRDLIGGDRLGILYFAWVIPALLLVAGLGIFFLRFFISLPPRVRLLTGIGAAMFLGGAVGFELLEGYHVETASKETLEYFMLTTGEEFLEMAGIIVFIRALLEYLADEFPNLTLVFTNTAAATRSRANAIKAVLVTNEK
jgi:hypothetical protein